MTTHLSQIRNVELFLDAGERIGIQRKEIARRILRGDRSLWSDFQRLYVWASELAPEIPQ